QRVEADIRQGQSVRDGRRKIAVVEISKNRDSPRHQPDHCQTYRRGIQITRKRQGQKSAREQSKEGRLEESLYSLRGLSRRVQRPPGLRTHVFMVAVFSTQPARAASPGPAGAAD